MGRHSDSDCESSSSSSTSSSNWSRNYRHRHDNGHKRKHHDKKQRKCCKINECDLLQFMGWLNTSNSVQQVIGVGSSVIFGNNDNAHNIGHVPNTADINIMLDGTYHFIATLNTHEASQFT